MGRLQGKVALVTGAAADPGLGAATALRFAQEGAQLAVTDVEGEALEHLADRIAQGGGTVVALRHEVTSEADWDAVFAAVEERYGALHVLVNNVGIAIPRAFADTTLEEWRRQQDVNVTSMYLGCRRAVALMRQGQGGSIINIASIAGQVGMPNMVAYSASKGAVRLLTKGLALEVAREGIRVNSVHPGTMRTRHHIEAVAKDATIANALKAQIPMGRFGEPEDIANMNLFLASDEARYVTGAEFVVDGGYTAA